MSFLTTPRKATHEMSFNMVYGSEVVLPPEIGLEIARVFVYNSEGNISARVEESDLVEEK